MAVHIVSLGTSVLTNLERKRDQTTHTLPNPRDDSAWEPLAASASFRAEVHAFLEAAPREHSAEINSLWEFLEAGTVEAVHLVATRTHRNRIAERAVRAYLQKVWQIHVENPLEIEAGVDPAPVPEASGAEAAFVRDLGALRDQIMRYVQRRRRDGKEVYINATAGLKAEVVTLASLGHLLGCRVYYRHETFERTVILPPVTLAAGDGAQVIEALLTEAPEPPHRLVGPEAEACVRTAMRSTPPCPWGSSLGVRFETIARS